VTAPRVLAIDLATVGAAAWTAGALGKLDTMHFDLRERAGVTKAQQAKSHGALFASLHTMVTDLIDAADPEVVAIEKDFGRGYSVLVMLGGLRAIAELAAAERGIRCITDIDASTARTLAGVGGGSTSTGRGPSRTL
jgi:Holliday junction resolvasome RuvABC endonuclease subunit